MAFTKVIKFNELVQKLSENGCNSSLCGLLNIQVPLYEFRNAAKAGHNDAKTKLEQLISAN